MHQTVERDVRECGDWGGAVRLLVVEDTPKMSALLERAFREDGYAVDVQASGDGAVWMASECDFDAVILDVGLPDVDGFEVCRQLRRRERWMPILMLTARESVSDRCAAWTRVPTTTSPSRSISRSCGPGSGPWSAEG